MKRILVLLLLVAAAVPALADPPGEDVHRPYFEGGGKWYVQGDLGLNFSFLSGNPVYRTLEAQEGPTDLFNSANGLAPRIGISLGYEFSPMFALSLGAGYDAYHASNSGSTGDTCVTIDTVTGIVTQNPQSVSKTFDVDASHLTITLLGNLRFDNLIVFFGPSAGVPLGHSTSETQTVSDTAACPFLPGTPDASTTISGSLSQSDNLKTRFSVKIGAGYVIPLTKKLSLVPQLAYEIGFTDLLKQGETNVLSTPRGVLASTSSINPAMRINALQASIGLRLNL